MILMHKESMVMHYSRVERACPSSTQRTVLQMMSMVEAFITDGTLRNPHDHIGIMLPASERSSGAGLFRSSGMQHQRMPVCVCARV